MIPAANAAGEARAIQGREGTRAMRDPTKNKKEEIVKDILDTAERKGDPKARRTELEHKVRDLAESEELYRTLVENCPIGMYRSTPDGRILFANRTILELFEYDTYRDYTEIDLKREGYDAGYPRKEFMEEVEFKGMVRGLEVTVVTRNGTRLSIRENSRVVRDATGKTLYYEGTMEDLSERNFKG